MNARVYRMKPEFKWSLKTLPGIKISSVKERYLHVQITNNLPRSSDTQLILDFLEYLEKSDNVTYSDVVNFSNYLHLAARQDQINLLKAIKKIFLGLLIAIPTLWFLTGASVFLPALVAFLPLSFCPLLLPCLSVMLCVVLSAIGLSYLLNGIKTLSFRKDAFFHSQGEDLVASKETLQKRLQPQFSSMVIITDSTDQRSGEVLYSSSSPFFYKVQPRALNWVNVALGEDRILPIRLN